MTGEAGTKQIKSTRHSIRNFWRVALVTTVFGFLSVAAHAKPLRLVAFGDSLTAGYNLPPGEDFASRLKAALRQKGHDVRITNAGVSGDTTTGGLARFDWAIAPQTDAVILELGANDALRGVSPAVARKNLNAILGKLKARNIAVLLAGMRAPANWGPDYVTQFDAIYPQLAKQHGVLLYPFFMAGVIEHPSLKLADALHPNKAGVAEIVRRILPDVEHLLEQAQAR